MENIDREGGYKVALPQIVGVTVGLMTKFVFFVGESQVGIKYVYHKSAWRWWTRMKKRGYKISSNFNEDHAYGYIPYPKTVYTFNKSINPDFLDF